MTSSTPLKPQHLQSVGAYLLEQDRGKQMNHDYCVYMHIFPNGKRYIGITCCQPYRRWQKGYGYRNQAKIYNAIKKYGWENIRHEILFDGLTLEEANQKEIELIQKYKTIAHGYNVELGGKACGHLTQEHKNKIGQANSGKNNGMYGYQYTDEEKAEIARKQTGHKHTEESRKKMSEYAKAHSEIKSHPGCTHPMYGKQHSDESKIKMSESAKKRGYCGSKNKRVDMLTVDDVYIRTFDSIEEAARFTGKKNGAPNIRSVCLGNRKKAHGFKWRYTDANKSSV